MTFAKYGFDEVLVDATRRSPKVQATEYMVAGHFPVIDQGALDVAGYVDDELLVTRVDRPRILFGDHTRRFKYASSDFVLGADGVKALEVLPGFDPRYVFHALRHMQLPSAGYSRHFKFLKAATLLAPDLEEQERIAAILDQADELRAKRRRTLTLLDELPERIFAKKFLDVGRAFKPLGDLAAWQSGGTPSRSQTAFFCGDIPWMTSGELGPVRAVVSNEMLTTEAVARSSAKIIPHGSLLLGMYDTAALKSSISVGEIACNQAVAFGVPSSGVTPEFLYFAVRSQRASVLARRRGARQKNLNLSMIRSITVPVVSAAEQTEFADVVREVEALRAAAEAHLAHLDELFASLQHRAFIGQL